MLAILREGTPCLVKIEIAPRSEAMIYGNAFRELFEEAKWPRAGLETSQNVFADVGDTGLMLLTSDPTTGCFLTMHKALSVLSFISWFEDKDGCNDALCGGRAREMTEKIPN